MSLAVSYGARTARVKYTPATLLGEIKSQACTTFGLDGDQFELSKSGKPGSTIDESLPMRLSNLVGNARLELKPRSAKSRAAGSSAVVRVKVQVVDLPLSFSESLVGDFAPSTSLWSILAHFEKKSGINFTRRAVEPKNKGESAKYYEMPSVMLFNRMFASFDELNRSLLAIGLKSGSSAAFKVRFVPTSIPFEEAVKQQGGASESETPSQVPATAPASVPNSESPSTSDLAGLSAVVSHSTQAQETEEQSSQILEPPTQVAGATDRNVHVYLQGESGQPVSSSAEAPADMAITSSQFVRYHSQIKNMADGAASRPLMTKALREAAETQKQASITSCDVRVRLPDQSYIEATFGASEKLEELFNLVRSMLSEGLKSREFSLVVTPPRRVLNPADTFVRGAQLSARNLVFFEWTSPGGPSATVLSSKYRTGAKSMSDNIKQAEAAAQPAPSSQSSSSSTSERKSTSTGMPKWLKLSKK